ncbi:ABC transporter ATP-binding protein [Bacillus massilinigeriensis]|uniref:ABC transporter ATP-binding protein n=1 Tax=Bacillus massilionigeriensis TaxID=1805475 RepID=UPI00096B3F55|nr:dipeptide ABC transporter ATP-binding protein [Bacillus massilionigeriensis]
MNPPLLEVKGLTKSFPISGSRFREKKYVHAVNGVNLKVSEGETLAIVGESGCGKSTTGRLLLRLLEPDEGIILYEGKNLMDLGKKEMKEVRKDFQMVFQNPFDTLNPRHTIKKILSEPLIAHKIEREKRDYLVEEMIERVGLTRESLTRYPFEFSGGQRQRIGIARALMLKPKLIVADEPVSALDVSIQSQILNLLQDLQEQLNLTYIFISHDLQVVQYIATNVAVMYFGEVIEYAKKEDIFTNPYHPYTKSLLTSIPKKDPDEQREKIILTGDFPSPSNPPSGCKFHTRCPMAREKCKKVAPTLLDYENRKVACHFVAN